MEVVIIVGEDGIGERLGKGTTTRNSVLEIIPMPEIPTTIKERGKLTLKVFKAIFKYRDSFNG